MDGIVYATSLVHCDSQCFLHKIQQELARQYAQMPAMLIIIREDVCKIAQIFNMVTQMEKHLYVFQSAFIQLMEIMKHKNV